MLPLMHDLPQHTSTSDGVHTYHLAEFYTPLGTSYYQYIHSSLIKGGFVSLSTCREKLPVWDLCIKGLEANIRPLVKKSRVRRAFRQN